MRIVFHIFNVTDSFVLMGSTLGQSLCLANKMKRRND